MRVWTYSYKTSDGLRHEDEMSAPSKDDVYAALRARGIRAIRVEERIAPVVRRGFRGLRKRDWSLMLLCAAVAVAAAVVMIRRNAVPAAVPPVAPAREPDATLDEPHFKRLAKSVEDAMSAFRDASGTLDLALLSNYRLAATESGVARMRAEIERGRKMVEAARLAVRGVYDLQYGTIPATCVAETEAAQRLFGLALSEIDAFSEGLDGDECALGLLAENRGAWRTASGAVRWDDPRLEREFQVFRRAGSCAPVRWARPSANRKKNLEKFSDPPLTGVTEK